MHARDFPHDRQPKPGAFDRLRLAAAMEALEHRVAFVGRNARPVVDHVEPRLFAVARDTHRDHRMVARITDRVVDQVADHLAEQVGLAEHVDVGLVFEAEIDVARAGDGRPVERHAAGKPVQRDRLVRDRMTAVRIEPRQRQQLLDDLRGLPHRAVRAPQMHVRARLLVRPQREFDARLDGRERRLQLMGRIGEEAPPRHLHPLRAADVLVDRIDERREFARHRARVERRRVVLAARGDGGRQPVQRPQPAADAEPHDPERQHDEQPFLQQRPDQDLARERLARLDRLADHHPHDARLRGRHVVHRDAQCGHPQLFAAIHDVVVPRDEQRAVARVAALRQRQVRIAGDRVAVVLADQVVDLAAVARFEHFEREIRQVDLDLAVVEPHAFADRLQRRRQRAVERGVRGAHRTLVREPRVEREQAQQRQQQPQRDLRAQVRAGHPSAFASSR
ncbi:PAS [Burkholderia cenocepacia PC184]|nr:PAS [Burkholderia cenocepacia PC184]